MIDAIEIFAVLPAIIETTTRDLWKLTCPWKARRCERIDLVGPGLVVDDMPEWAGGGVPSRMRSTILIELGIIAVPAVSFYREDIVWRAFVVWALIQLQIM